MLLPVDIICTVGCYALRIGFNNCGLVRYDTIQSLLYPPSLSIFVQLIYGRNDQKNYHLFICLFIRTIIFDNYHILICPFDQILKNYLCLITVFSFRVMEFLMCWLFLSLCLSLSLSSLLCCSMFRLLTGHSTLLQLSSSRCIFFII